MFIPVVIEFMQMAEEAFPGQNKGIAKLTFVRGLLEDVYQLTEGIDKDIDFEKVWLYIGKAITAICDERKKKQELEPPK